MKYFWKKFLRFLFADGVRKSIAFLLAVIIYVTIYNIKTERKTLEGVVVDINAEDTLCLSATQPKVEKVDIVVSGPPRDIANITAGNFRGEVTVRETDRFTPGFYRVVISPRIFQNSGQVRVVEILKKSYLPINAQHKMRKYCDIQVKTTGSLSGDYKLGNISCVPHQIQVEGPENILQQLQFPPIEIALTPENVFSFEREVDLLIDNQNDQIGEVLPGNVISPLQKKTIKVTVEILAKDPVSAVIPDLEIKMKKNKNDIKLENSKVDLTIIGVPSQVEALKKDPKNIEVYVDIAEIAEKPGTYSLEVKHSLPKDGVKVEKVTPERVNVTISPKSILDKLK